MFFCPILVNERERKEKRRKMIYLNFDKIFLNGLNRENCHYSLENRGSLPAQRVGIENLSELV